MCFSHLDCVFNLKLQGHLLLIGVSGAGKTTLSRFVAWLNGLSVFQIKVCLHVCLSLIPVHVCTCKVRRSLAPNLLKNHSLNQTENTEYSPKSGTGPNQSNLLSNLNYSSYPIIPVNRQKFTYYIHVWFLYTC